MTLKGVKKRSFWPFLLIYLPLYIMSSFTIVSLIYLFRDFCLKLIRKTLLALSVSIFDVEQISIMRLQTYWTTPLLGPTEIPAHSTYHPCPSNEDILTALQLYRFITFEYLLSLSHQCYWLFAVVAMCLLNPEWSCYATVARRCLTSEKYALKKFILEEVEVQKVQVVPDLGSYHWLLIKVVLIDGWNKVLTAN